MKAIITTLLILSVSGFAQSAERTPEQIAARQQKEQQRDYRRCVKQMLGTFGGFKSTAVHIKAAEACKDVKQNTAQASN